MHSLPNIVLIGFMGSGKSSVGRILAAKLGRRMLDTDALVVEAAGMQIPDIFAARGEEAFRDYESRVLTWLLERPVSGAVIATGGGIVLREANVARLRELGFVALLTADEETLFERVSRKTSRPLLQTPDPRATLRELLALREPFYAKAADFTLDTTPLTHAQVADAVMAEAQRRYEG